MEFQELNNDQRREVVNTRQRFAAYRDAKKSLAKLRGSMVWVETKGHEYLIRSAYAKAGGPRKQSSLGPRSPDTERIKSEYERDRARADLRFKELRQTLSRQAAVNRALGLGRVPLTGARIIRALDDNGLLGAGIRILGTNALYAFEAAAGVFVEAGLTTTEDIDLLFDSRRGLSFVANDDVSEASIMQILNKVDRSFEKSAQTFRATNRAGYLVDLIKPMRNPPWQDEPDSVGADPNDLTAVEIAGLAWLENAPAFETIAVDEKGDALRMVTPDPRVWASHKLWLSKRADRDPLKRTRDAAQAKAAAHLVRDYLTNLQFEADSLRMLPRSVFEDAAPLFEPPASDDRA